VRVSDADVPAGRPHDAAMRNRQSIRLRGFDYRRPGAYFVTIGTWRMVPILGRVIGAGFEANELGRIVGRLWQDIPLHFPTVSLDTWCVMPNHFHGILWLEPADGSPRRCPTLGLVIRLFKASAARRINLLRGTPGAAVWHRNYFERIIRDDRHLNATRRYIDLNPARWRRNH